MPRRDMSHIVVHNSDSIEVAGKSRDRRPTTRQCQHKQSNLKPIEIREEREESP